MLKPPVMNPGFSIRFGIIEASLAQNINSEGHIETKQELQEVLKFPIKIFWNYEASLKSELLYF